MSATFWSAAVFRRFYHRTAKPKAAVYYKGALNLREQIRESRTAISFFAIRFPNLPQWTFGAVDRIAIGNWQTSDGAIGFWPLARQTTKQVPLASMGVSSHNPKIRAGADVLVSDTGRN